jgi:holo-[acyl-carrier protein] synthase
VNDGRGVEGVGIDGVEVERIRRMVERYHNGFLNRVYSASERAYCLAKMRPFASLAVRFAAKEAVSKALGCGIGTLLGWRDVVVEHDAYGTPQIVVTEAIERLLQRHGAKKILISLFHSKSFAQAVALLVA